MSRQIHLRWRNHINGMCKKASSTLGFIRRNFYFCPRETRLIVYISLVRSLLEYGAPIWDPILQREIEQIEKGQRQAARFICRDYKSRYPGAVTKMLENLDLPTLQQRRRNQRLTLLYKIAEGQLPAIDPDSYLHPLKNKRRIKPNTYNNHVSSNPISKYETNNSRCFAIPQAKSGGPFNQSFFPRTITDWNKLDERIVTAGSLNTFKTQLSEIGI